MNLRKLLLPIALSVGALFGSPPKAGAQVSNYTFAQTSAGTYTPLVNPTVLATATAASGAVPSLDSYVDSVTTMPFSFEFAGTQYTKCYMSSNGFITFGGAPSTTLSAPISSTVTTFQGVISAWARDLNAIYNLTDANNTVYNGEMSWGVTGTAPNRRVVLQWKNFRPVFNSSTTLGYAFDFQIMLEETTNKVYITYGGLLGYISGTTSYASTSQIGLRGATNGDFNNRLNPTTTAFVNATAGTANSSTQAFSTSANPPGMPTSGLTYIWTPGTCFAPTTVTTGTITTTSTVVNWTAPSTAPSNGYQYEVRTSGAAGSGATGLAASGATAAGVVTANITGLSAATTYTVYVRGNCGAVNGNSTWTTGLTFTTLCATFAAPFQEGFNGGSLPNCWTNSNSINSTTANLLWKFSGAPDYGTTGNGRPTGSYAWVDASSPYNAVVTLTSPAINLSTLTSPYVKFDWFKNNGSTATTFTNNNLQVEGYNGTAWVSLFNDTSNANSWRTVGLALPASFNGITNAQFRFNVDKSLSGDFYDDILLDSFAVQNAPPCIAPNSVATSNVTSNGVSVSWVAFGTAPSSGYQYEVRTSGAAGSGATGLVASGTTAAGVLTANVTGLSAITTYTVYVRGNCGTANGFSTWTTGPTFTTLCATFTTPFQEGFNVGSLPGCWTNSNSISSTTANLLWKFGTGFANGTASNGRPSGSFAFVDASSPYNAVVTLTSPVINLSTLTSPYVRFDWFKNNSSVGINPNNNLQVEGYNGTAWVSLFNDTSNANSWRTVGLTLPASFNGITNAQFRFNVDKTLSNNQFDDVLLDSLSIINTPSCIVPGSPVVSAVTTTGATITWTASASTPASGYQYEVRTSGAAGSGATGLVASGSTAAGVLTANVTGLSAITTYNVYVRSNCGAPGFSIWTPIVTFTTPCATFTAPFQEGFNGGSLPNCWDNTNSINSTTANLLWKFGSGFGYGTTSNGRPSGSFAFVDASSPYNAVVTLTSPVINLSTLTSPYVKFDWFKNNGSTATTFTNNNLQVEGYNGTAWVSLFNDTSNANSWRTVGLALPASFNGITNAQFRFNVDKSLSGDFYDDILLDSFAVQNTPSCIVPGTVTASSVAANSVTLTWGASSSAPASGYQYEVRSSGAAGSGATGLAASGSTAAGVLTINVTGLVATTTYTAYVRSNCGPGNTSAWVSTTFTTSLDCATAPVISGCGISQTFTTPAGTGVWNLSTATPAGPFGTNGIEKLYTFTPTATGVYTLNVTAVTGGYVDYFVKPVSSGCNMNGFRFIKDINGVTTDTFTLQGGVSYYILADPEGTAGVSQTFSITCPPSCGVPTALTASTITTTSVVLGWTPAAGNTTSQWQISYGTSGTTAAAGTKVVVSTNPYTLPGLTASTAYTAYVRAICGANDTSAWSASTSFTTQCLPSTLPFVENFATVPPACWSLATGTLTATPSSPTAATSNNWGLDQYLNNSANGPAARNNIFSTNRRDWLISPSINLGSTAGNYTLGFNLGVVAYSSSTSVASPVGTTLGSDDTLAVLVSTNNGASWSTANAVQTFTATNTPINAAGNQRYTVALNGLSGQIKIAFYGSSGAVNDAADNDVFIDSVTVNTAITCTNPVVNLGNDTGICVGSSLTLNAGNATGATYLWSTNATTQTISVMAAGTYTVQVTVPGGCIGRDTIVVSVNPLPVVNLGPDTAFCAGGSVTLNAGNAGASYLWSTAATTQTISVSTAGSYSVRVTNANGCIGRDTIVVSVNPLPVVNLGPDTTFCAGNAVTLNAGNAGASYLWSTGATTQTVSVSTAGSYSVRVTNAGGCIGRDTVVVNINAAPVVALGTDTAFCGGSSATLDAGNAGSAYLWSTGATTQTVVATTAGSYSVQVTNAGGCIGRDTINVIVNPLPTSGVISTTGASPTFTFTAVGNMNDSLRGWSFGDGTVDTAGLPITTTHTYTANGTYTVTFYVANACGVDSTTVSVTVSNIGINDVSLNGEITLFPNPASEFVMLKNTSTQSMKHITVLNALGAVVSDLDVSNSKQERVNIGGLAAGSYLIRIQLDNTTVVRRLQITK